MIIKRGILTFFLLCISLFAEENISLENSIKKTNEQIKKLRNELSEKVLSVSQLYDKNAQEDEYLILLEEIKAKRKEILDLEENFRKTFLDDSVKTDEGYSFWDQAESTISQLVMEYGSQDYLYVVPNEIANIKINLFSTIPIPRESWDEMISFILNQNGIGIKKINPFLRQLYILKHDPSYVEGIVSKVEDLEFFADSATICFIFSPPFERLKEIQIFLERFSDVKQTIIHPIKNNIVVVGSKDTIKRLINLYEALFNKEKDKIIKVIPLSKIEPLEAEKIIQTYFSQAQKGRPSFFPGSLEELTVIPQGSSLILIGMHDNIEKAENIVQDLEKQLLDPDEMIIFWYTCKNSNPQDLAETLEKVYLPMTFSSVGEKKLVNQNLSDLSTKNKLNESKQGAKSNKNFSGNFIVDAKSGSILMVIKKAELDKIKALLQKLDAPKKMVQIDVLLVERKIQDRKQTGINLLKLGSASGTKESAISFDTGSTAKRKGILDFILSRPKGKFFAFDLTLSFLMAEDDMRISDCPTILAVNQTPAVISVVDEISINNGAIQVDSSGGQKFEKSFTRAQFGTTIILTPTIHLSEDESEEGYVTLHSDISFDTTKTSDSDKPAVTRRHIENEVRVADGQTVILGGLRRKTSEEGSEKIPFLGELPGVGKLFGSTKKSDGSSEMYIFITPHIIKDPKVDLEKQKKENLSKRQGDIDEFVYKLEIAKTGEKRRLFEKSMKLILEEHE